MFTTSAHKSFQKFLFAIAASLPILLCWGCDSGSDGLMADLTDGYWLADATEDSEAFMISFSDSGQVFSYVCAAADNGGFDAYYDSSFTDFYKYAVDISNKRLCFLPDRWFDILVLNKNTLTLGADDNSSLKFSKIGFDDVNVVSPEQFFLLHPDFPQNL